MVEIMRAGIEPITFWSRVKCTTSNATGGLYVLMRIYTKSWCNTSVIILVQVHKEKLWWDRMIDKGNTKCRISIWGGIILSNILPLQQVVCYQRLLYVTNPIMHLRSPVAILHLFINKKKIQNLSMNTIQPYLSNPLIFFSRIFRIYIEHVCPLQ